MKLAIVGTGISGLATAFFVRWLRPEWEIVLFEKERQPGGTMRTETVDGFRFETGANGFLDSRPDTLALVRECGAEALLLPSSDAARKRYLYTDRLHPLPESPAAFLRSRLLSPLAKLRVLAEVVIPARRGTGDETVQSFGYRRVGKAFTDVFLDAMCAGIHAATPARLSVSAAFPLVVRLEREYGGLFRGMIKMRRGQAGPGGRLTSFRGGVSTFIDHLARGLCRQPHTTLHTGVPVAALERTAGGYRLHSGIGEEEADAVVLATPAHASAALLGALDPALAAALEAIAYSPVAVVGLGYHRLDRPLDGFGLLTTSGAGLDILGVLWDSAVFPDRAPPGAAALRVMIGGQRNPELVGRDDAQQLEIARRGVAETMGVTAAPDVTFVKRWRRGIPHYAVGHLARINALFARLQALPGLYLNSNAYYGIGLNDCVAASRDCAAAIADRRPYTRRRPDQTTGEP